MTGVTGLTNHQIDHFATLLVKLGVPSSEAAPAVMRTPLGILVAIEKLAERTVRAEQAAKAAKE